MRSIMRSGYTAIRNGKKIRVRPTPIPDVGAAGKGPKLIGKLKGGMLTKYGYHPVESMTARHRALTMAIKKGREAPLAVFRRLQAIGTLTKRTLPTASRTYIRDRNWIREKFM